MTSTGTACSWGSGQPTLASLLLLVLIAPAAIAFYVVAASGSLRKAWAPMLVSAVLAVPVVYVVLFAWAAAHGCFE